VSRLIDHPFANRLGLGEAVGGVLIYVHKERELRILTAVTRAWGDRVTIVFPRQGHDAHDPEILATNPAADLTVEHIGDLVDYDLSTLRGRAGAGAAAEPGQRR
jgi:hypothetical protein